MCYALTLNVSINWFLWNGYGEGVKKYEEMVSNISKDRDCPMFKFNSGYDSELP